jgi:hypothetical protein
VELETTDFAWRDRCKPKEEGGLGLKDPVAWLHFHFPSIFSLVTFSFSMLQNKIETGTHSMIMGNHS